MLRNPSHPYTRRLLSAVPIPDPTRKRPPVLAREGEIGSPVWPRGQGPERLPLEQVAPGHWVAGAGRRESAA